MAVLDFRQIAIDRFIEITKFQLSDYMIRVDSFFTVNYPKIRDWYSGNTNKPDIKSFKLLDRLVYESTVISDLVYENSKRFDKAYFWDLLENLEDLKVRLLSATNLSKFLRSIRTKNSYQNSIDVNYTMKKFDTLESIQNKKISPTDFDNQWINIALRNDLSEEEYDGEGGQNIQLPSNFSTLFLSSIVDNLIEDRLYGRDINKKITFKDDDLEVLDFKPTVLQSLEILISVRRGSVPEFPGIGISEELVVGSNTASLSYPILQRQLNDLFSTDDSFVNFSIKNIQQDKDAVFIAFEVNTVRGEILQNTIQITP